MTIGRGIIAGAVGTVTLNVLTYLDMAARGRASSSLPAQTVKQAADAAGTELASDEDTADNRSQGVGALLGYASGLGFGALYGALRSRADLPVAAGGLGLTLAAMVGGSGPAVALGLTDPREWGAQAWVSDIVPHLAYGFVTAGVYDAITEGGRR